MRLCLLIPVCPFLAGCLAYGYPDVSRTPPVAIDTPDVKAFRVADKITMWGPIITGPMSLERSIEEIPVENAIVSAQHDTFFSYYYIFFPLLSGSRDRKLDVMLYRPGYQIVDIRGRAWWEASWSDKPEPVVWKEAPDLNSQMAAVQRLSPRHMLDRTNKEVLKFAAAEYTRLANSPLAATKEMAETRKQLLDYAQECSDMAEPYDRLRLLLKESFTSRQVGAAAGKDEANLKERPSSLPITSPQNIIPAE
jgi:hypothetical protein